MLAGAVFLIGWRIEVRKFVPSALFQHRVALTSLLTRMNEFMDPHDTPIEVSCQEVKRALDASEPLLLLDCREQNEYDVAAIPQAVLLPMSQLESRLSELEEHRNGRIVIHCHHGGRSLRVAGWLREQGFPNSQSMAGGIDTWAAEIAPGMARY
jgi:rhodanese-related sulfurtransferase